MDNYLDEFLDLVVESGYTDPKVLVVKFRRGLDPQIQNAMATMANRQLLDFERLRLIINSLIPEVSISQECLERSSSIASFSELDKEQTKELFYDTTVYILEGKGCVMVETCIKG